MTIGMMMSAVAALGVVFALSSQVGQWAEANSVGPHPAICMAALPVLAGLSIGSAMRLGFHQQMAAIGLAAGALLLGVLGVATLPIDREWSFSYWVLGCLACLCVGPQLALRFVPETAGIGGGRLAIRSLARGVLASGLTVLAVILTMMTVVLAYDIFGI